MIGSSIRFANKTLAFTLLPLASSIFVNPALAQEPPWMEVEIQHFNFFRASQRCQGITTDHQGNLWFSANQTLVRTLTFTGGSEVLNDNPLPDELKSKGANHIGDIDYADGYIFAPIEDGSRYKHPFIGIYDARYLELQQFFTLPRDWQPDGVPWVTVDPIKKLLITSRYSGTTHINLYDLKTGQPLRQIPMSMPLNAIQGGKYWNDHLYMTADDPSGGFALFEMDLRSGDVRKMIHLNDEITEVEGLAFSKNPMLGSPGSVDAEISDFYVLGITGHGIFTKRLNLYHWKR